MIVHDPDVCQCASCCRRVYNWLHDGLAIEPVEAPTWREENLMRSKSLRTIEVSVVRGKGSLPGFLPLIQRHFEKSIPTTANSRESTINVSLDLLDLLVPDGLLKSIDSMEILYKK